MKVCFKDIQHRQKEDIAETAHEMIFKTFNHVNILWLNKLNSHEYKIGKSEKGSV